MRAAGTEEEEGLEDSEADLAAQRSMGRSSSPLPCSTDCPCPAPPGTGRCLHLGRPCRWSRIAGQDRHSICLRPSSRRICRCCRPCTRKRTRKSEAAAVANVLCSRWCRTLLGGSPTRIRSKRCTPPRFPTSRCSTTSLPVPDRTQWPEEAGSAAAASVVEGSAVAADL